MISSGLEPTFPVLQLVPLSGTTAPPTPKAADGCYDHPDRAADATLGRIEPLHARGPYGRARRTGS
jgi:hypothetical protein